MNLTILTPDKKIFDGEVQRINVPGAKGAFEVLNNHAALISTLVKGDVRYFDGDNESSVMITGGVIEVLRNNITLLAEGVHE